MPELVHAHDWQAGLAPGLPALLRRRRALDDDDPQHRLPGLVSGRVFGALELPPQAFSLDGVEYHGGVGYLKAGLANATAITTVSPTYAEEIRRPPRHGARRADRARAGVLHGIVNGIDTEV